MKNVLERLILERLSMKNIFLLFVLVGFSGCMSLLRNETEQVLVTTEPRGATASYGNQNVITPSHITVSRANSGFITVSKEGYKTVDVKFYARSSTGAVIGSVLLNLLHGGFTFWITFALGISHDSDCGALNYIEPNVISVELVEEENR